MSEAKFWGTAIVVKRHKRLLIEVMETGEHLYSPPSFIQIPSREPVHELAAAFTPAQDRSIDAIMAFESRWTKRPHA